MIRKVLFAMAGVVATLSLWLLLPELIRPGLSGFPQTLSAAQTAAASQGRAAWAARLAGIRCGLWTQGAIADTSPLAFELATAAAPQDSANIDRSSIERAGSWSPHDARAWLLLAATNLGSGGSDGRVIEALKLSYSLDQANPI